MDSPVPWKGSFVIDGDPDGPIAVRQIDLKLFRLDSTVRYVGARTGLEDVVAPEIIESIRQVDPAQLPTTDLTSVPKSLRWFVSQYGVHTPAALIHDALIGAERPVEGLTDEHADRYFRFMLEDLGVRWIRRWLMWAAVALRTRFCAGGVKRISIVAWVVASVLGLSTAVWALLAGAWLVLVGAVLAPLVFAALWGQQYGAGLAAAYTAPWVLPPTLFGTAGFVVYSGLEALADRFIGRRRAGDQPITYDAF
jgi:hypothetical protein